MRASSSPTVLAMFLLFCGVAGCGRNPAAEMPPGVPVSGTVTLDGKPVPGVTVTFTPVGSTRGDVCRAQTDKTGKYELKNRYGQKGAPAGEYKVTCTAGGGPGSDAMAEGASPQPAASVIIPERYSLEAKTELKANVSAGGGAIDFKLTSKK